MVCPFYKKIEIHEKNNLRTGQFGDGEAETFVIGHMAPHQLYRLFV